MELPDKLIRPDPALDRLEARFYRARRRLLRTDEGRWALVVHGTLQSEIEVFDTEMDAVHAGFQHPSRKRFCVKPIVEREEPIVINAALRQNRPEASPSTTLTAPRSQSPHNEVS